MLGCVNFEYKFSLGCTRWPDFLGYTRIESIPNDELRLIMKSSAESPGNCWSADKSICECSRDILRGVCIVGVW